MMVPDRSVTALAINPATAAPSLRLRARPPPARIKPRPGFVPSFGTVPANPPPLRHCGLHAAHQALAARRRLPRRVCQRAKGRALALSLLQTLSSRHRLPDCSSVGACCPPPAPSAIKPAHGFVGYAGEHQSGALARPRYERWSGVYRLRRFNIVIADRPRLCLLDWKETWSDNHLAGLPPPRWRG